MATPPTFTAGQVLTAAQMNSVGLWLVKSQVVGSTQSSVSVSAAFSADYDNYRIVYDGGTCSTNAALGLKLGSAVSGYFYAGLFNQYNSSTPQGLASGAGTSFADAGRASTVRNNLVVDLYAPYLSTRTGFRSYSIDYYGAAGFNVFLGGFLDNSTSYTDFTLTPGSGTLTGGTILVYGYNS